MGFGRFGWIQTPLGMEKTPLPLWRKNLTPQNPRQIKFNQTSPVSQVVLPLMIIPSAAHKADFSPDDGVHDTTIKHEESNCPDNTKTGLLLNFFGHSGFSGGFSLISKTTRKLSTRLRLKE